MTIEQILLILVSDDIEAIEEMWFTKEQFKEHKRDWLHDILENQHHKS